MDDAEAAYDRYQETWVRQDWNAWAATCGPGHEFTVNGSVLGGVEQVIAWGRGVFTRFPDYRHTVRTVVGDGGGQVVAEVVAHGSGAAGELLLPYVKVLTVVDGVVVADRQYHDQTLVPSA